MRHVILLTSPQPTGGGLGDPDVGGGEWVEKIDYKVDLWSRGRVLRRHQSLLARSAGQFTAARLLWDTTKNRPAWRVRNRVPRPIGKRAWGARLDQSVRN
jgi:hypothetical protein